VRIRRKSFTLAESLIAAAVLAMGVVAISLAMSAGHMQSHYATRGQQGMLLAEEMAELIVTKPYYDPEGSSALGPDAGESSVLAFDNVDDFHGYVEAAGALRDGTGHLYPDEYQVFGRQVIISPETRNVAGLGVAIPGLTVTVKAQDPDGPSYAVTRFVPEPID
jgi:hypothetical protein